MNGNFLHTLRKAEDFVAQLEQAENFGGILSNDPNISREFRVSFTELQTALLWAKEGFSQLETDLKIAQDRPKIPQAGDMNTSDGLGE